MPAIAADSRGAFLTADHFDVEPVPKTVLELSRWHFKQLTEAAKVDPAAVSGVPNARFRSLLVWARNQVAELKFVQVVEYHYLSKD